MRSVIRMSEATALGLHAMAAIAEKVTGDREGLMTVQAMAKALDASANHLSKVLQRLSHGGLVHAVRGPGGGYTLTNDPAKTSLLEIFELFEGPLALSGCLFSDSACERPICIMGGLIDRVNREVREYLEHTTLDMLAQQNCITDLRETRATAP